MANKNGGKPSDRRAGQRKDRNQRVGKRVPELGYYLIITDTEETEKNYFEGRRDSIPAELKDRLVIKVENTQNSNFKNIEKINELLMFYKLRTEDFVTQYTCQFKVKQK